jgi:hypothetical protein
MEPIASEANLGAVCTEDAVGSVPSEHGQSGGDDVLLHAPPCDGGSTNVSRELGRQSIALRSALARDLCASLLTRARYLDAQRDSTSTTPNNADLILAERTGGRRSSMIGGLSSAWI